jgi:hypothetical protein
MLPKVRKNVNQRISHGAWIAQLARVEAIRPESTTTPEEAIDSARYADRQALHASRELLRARGFDHQVYVIRLYRRVQDAKLVGRSLQRLPECPL